MRTGSIWKQFNMTFKDKVFGPTASLWQLCPLAADHDPSVAFSLFDDFLIQPSTKASQWGGWTIIEDDGAGGSDAVGDAAGGIYTQYCDGDDNDESYLIGTNETFKFAAGKSLWFEARLAIIQGATNKANWLVGLMDAAAADAIQNNGAGPAASYDGAVLFGVEGALSYFAESSAAGTQTTSAALGTIVSSTQTRFGFYFKSESSSDTTGTIQFYVDGVPVGDAHTITLSGLGEMHPIVGVKSDGSAEEAFAIDYMKIVQIR